MQATPKCDVFNNFGGFSKTFGRGGHQGVDIGATLGQEVYAVEDGVLTRQFTDLAVGGRQRHGAWTATPTRIPLLPPAAFAAGWPGRLVRRAS